LERPTGEPVAIVVGSPVRASWIHPMAKAGGRAILKWLSGVRPEHVFRTAAVPRADYRWRFFVRDPKQVYRTATAAMIGNKTRQFERVASHIEELHGFRSVRTKGFDSATRLGALAYLEIIDMRGYFRRDDEEENLAEVLRQHINTAARNQESAVGAIPALAADIIKSVLTGWLEPKSKRKQMVDIIRSSNGDAIARMVWEHLGSENARREVQLALAQAVEQSVVKPIDLARETRECTNEIRGKIERLIAPSRRAGSDPLGKHGPEKHGTRPAFRPDFSLTQVVDSSSLPTEPLDTRLRRRKLDSFESLVRNYAGRWWKPRFGDHASFAVDHGFASAVVALSSSAEYESCLNTLKAPAARKSRSTVSLRAALGVCCSANVDRLALANDYLRAQVAEAIVLHNIYPEDLDASPSYRTHLSHQPISYLAILADTLQRWDRNAMANEARSAFFGGIIAASRYNIMIQNDIFHISLIGERADIQKEQKMREDLRAFLRDADSLVKLRLEES
jgi:hypothetical protein